MIKRLTEWLAEHHGISGQITPLVGDCDLNFKLSNEQGDWVVKLSQQDVNALSFQTQLLSHLTDLDLSLPTIKPDSQGRPVTPLGHDQFNSMRLMLWQEGNMWVDTTPHTEEQWQQLGQQAGALCAAMADFDHPGAHRTLDWDVAQGLWVHAHLSSFDSAQSALIEGVLATFSSQKKAYDALPRQVIHNDLNDHNIVVKDQQVTGFIDFGDAVYSQRINELAIVCAYAICGQANPLDAAVAVVKGFHRHCPITEDELSHLHNLIAMRAVISVTHSQLAKTTDPDNAYKNVSEAGFWGLLKQWTGINPTWALACFRHACGFPALPAAEACIQTLKNHPIDLNDLMPSQSRKSTAFHPDMSVGSTWLGHANGYSDFDAFDFKIKQLQKANPDAFIVGGYGECRPFYTSDAFRSEGNNGFDYRCCHLGIDLWSDGHAPVHAPWPGTVISAHDNAGDKNYGPTLIVKHELNGCTFYTLYGHLSQDSLSISPVGRTVKAGDLLCQLGLPHENGGWSPHLHFQIIVDLLGNEHDFYGACRPEDMPVMSQICIDPNLCASPQSHAESVDTVDDLLSFRHNHLGKSLSLAHGAPMQMLRGDGVHMMDAWGQKYLDTCNNVAHLGHEHPAVVQAGQAQMALLNTNSRYVHPEINRFVETLLKTLPPELSVVHCVNSGSEANELAMRMAKAHTGGDAFVALEAAYHGNSQACIDVSDYKFSGQGGAGCPEKTHLLPLPDAFRGRHRGPGSAGQYAAHAHQTLAELQAKGQKIAAFIAESIVSCGGQIEPPSGYFQQVYASVRAAGGLCIADEVQTGCGRVGTHFWAFQRHNVVPDIVTIGKPIGNGHPLAVVVCSEAVAKSFANGMEYFNTFGGNPVSARIGRAVLETIENQQLQAHALRVGNHLQDGLKSLQSDHPIIADVRGSGLFLGFELCDEDLNPLPDHAAYLADRMRTLKILISTDGPDHNVIKIKPPMCFDIEHADELLRRLNAVLKESAMRV